MLEQFLMKYGWTGAGMVLISIPILTSRRAERAGAVGISERTEWGAVQTLQTGQRCVTC